MAPDLNKFGDGIARGSSGIASMPLFLHDDNTFALALRKKRLKTFHTTSLCFLCSSLLYRVYCCRSIGKHKPCTNAEPTVHMEGPCFKEECLEENWEQNGYHFFGR